MFSINKERFFTIANLISFVRIGIAIFFFYLLLKKYNVVGIFFLGLFIFLDILDGYIARKLNCISNIGIMLDHGTDKFFAMGTLFILFLHGVIPLFVFVIFILRDITMLIGWIFIRTKKNLLLTSKFYGKVAGGFYFLFLYLYLAGYEELLLPTLFITLILYYVSAFCYAKVVLEYGGGHVSKK